MVVCCLVGGLVVVIGLVCVLYYCGCVGLGCGIVGGMD